MQPPQRHLPSLGILKYVVLLLVVLLGTISGSYAQARRDTCSVVGIARGETLSVRSGPRASSPIIAKLPAGTTGIQVLGRIVMNGSDDWVPIRFSSGKGWVRPKFLSRSRQETPHAISRRASESSGRAPYPTGQSSDFFGAGGPRIQMVPNRSLAYSYASQGYFNRAAVCVAHGDGTDQDITDGKAAYKRSNTLTLTPMGKRLLKGVKYVPRRDVTCPSCDGTGRAYSSGSCWKCDGRGTVKAPQGWNAILGLD